MARKPEPKSFVETAMDAVFTNPRANRAAIRKLLREAADNPKLRVEFCGDPTEYGDKQTPLDGVEVTRLSGTAEVVDTEAATPFGKTNLADVINDMSAEPEVVLRPFQAIDDVINNHGRTLRKNRVSGDIVIEDASTQELRESINPLSILTDESLPLMFLDFKSVYEDIDPPLRYKLLINGCMSCFIQRGRAYVLLMPKIKWVDRQLIHCPDGAAVIWGSGAKEYYWRGLQVPSYFITRRNQLSLNGLFKIENSEYRRCYLEIIGPERLLQSEYVSKIATDKYGELYIFSMRNDDNWNIEGVEARFVRVVNGTPNPDGSKKYYTLWVPDHMRSAHEAVAWTYGLTAAEYNPDART